MINITVQSLNNKTIEAIYLSNLSSSTFNNGQLKQLSYDNTLINIHTNVSSTFNLNNFFSNISGMNNDLVFVIIFGILLFVLFVGLKVARKL